MVTAARSGSPTSAGGRLHRWWVRGAAAVAAALVASMLTACFGNGDGHGVVVRVIDGDTLVALVDGEETTIRLLNIDTPETKDPDEEVQCLGPEATAFLTERLPAGTEIDLEYDEERLDPYDRTLAGVYESDSLINAEIAEEGLGVPVYFAPNKRFLPEVEEAAENAQRNEAGLFSPELACTLPAQLQALSSAVDEVPAAVDGDPGDALDAAGELVAELDVFVAALDVEGVRGLGNAVMSGEHVGSYLDDLRETAGDERDRAESARETLDELKTDFDEEQERLEKERQEEQERLEREEQERLEQEEREREEQREREREEERERERTKAPSSTSSGSSRGSSGEQGSSGGSGGSSSSGESSGRGSAGGEPSGGSDGSKGSGCTPYGPEISYSDDGGYTGKRYGMPGGKTFRKCD